MNFREFKKEVARKQAEDETKRELTNAITALTRKRDTYTKEAKDALREGNTSLYKAKVAALKFALFNLKQAQDMHANLMIAIDMREMQGLSKKFVKSLDSIMESVCKTCKSINLEKSQNISQQAIFQNEKTSRALQQVLESNNMVFESSVSRLSDVSDDEIKELLQDQITSDEMGMDSRLDDLERALLGDSPMLSTNSTPKEVVKDAVQSGFAMPAPTMPAPKAETPTFPSVDDLPPPNLAAKAPEIPSEQKPNPYQPSVSQKPSALEEEHKKSPEDELLGGDGADGGFIWDNIPSIGFEDIAGLEDVKEVVQIKVLLPLKNPEAFAGYEKKNGGGLCLYGPPGTGKTMIAAAIAKEIGAKFCSVKPSDLLQQGAGNTERAVRTLFKQARKFPCAVIYFDEMDSISPKSTKSQYAKQLRSEFLAQLQGIESYGKDTGNILFLICATNKPWDIDSAFLRPGRFGTKIYVGLPDDGAREYMINKRLTKLINRGVVDVHGDIDVSKVVDSTSGFNGADITNFLDKIEEISIIRGIRTGEKFISNADFEKALEEVHSSVQTEDLIKLKEWRAENDS
ncbi:MAG: AAA family ATPase [Clostridiales bacterium]|nr:AAA family ATPase [Clostridiales bacterium]